MTRPYNHPESIKTLEDIKARCFVDEFGCWVWKLSVDKDGQAKVSVRFKGKRVQTTTRRVAWMLKAGQSVPKGRVVYHTGCMNRQCVNPEHLSYGTKAQAGEHLRKLGYLRGHPARVVTNTRMVREHIAKLDWDKVREIRTSDEPRSVLAHKHGIAVGTVRDVQNHRCWREAANGASVFSWKPAA